MAPSGGNTQMRGGVTRTTRTASSGSYGVSSGSFLSTQSVASVTFLSSSPTKR
jgi:hypothetical protein